MKSHEEILRLYREHFGHSHEAGVFAVYRAGLEDGKEAQRRPVPPETMTAAKPLPVNPPARPVPPLIVGTASRSPLPIAPAISTATHRPL